MLQECSFASLFLCAFLGRDEASPPGFFKPSFTYTLNEPLGIKKGKASETPHSLLNLLERVRTRMHGQCGAGEHHAVVGGGGGGGWIRQLGADPGRGVHVYSGSRYRH